jgi:hypothetical protein
VGKITEIVSLKLEYKQFLSLVLLAAHAHGQISGGDEKFMEIFETLKVIFILYIKIYL